MIVSEAIDLLIESELKQLAIKDNKTAILGYLNSAILEIHKRFNLWNAEAIITMATGVTIYTLDGVDTNVAISLSDHEFMFVEAAYEATGEQLTINDELDPLGIATPKYNQIEVVTIVNAQTISIIYRATPKALTHEKAVIPLPPQFTEALFLYVGYRAHTSVKGDIKEENNTHFIRFEQSIKRIEKNGLFNQDDLITHKFTDRGFV